MSSIARDGRSQGRPLLVRFFVVAISFAILHFILTMTLLFGWSNATKADDQRTWGAFGYTAGMLLITAPLYQIDFVREHMRFLPAFVINSLLWGTVFALIVTRIRRFWLWVPVALLGLPLLWYEGWIVAAHMVEQRTDRDWTSRLRNRIPIAQRFPRQAANDASRRLDRSSAALAGQDSNGIRSRLTTYLNNELGRGDEGIEEPPPDIEHFMTAHRFDIDDLESQMGSGDPPQWEVDLTNASSLNSLRFYSLQKIVLLDALESARRNDFDGARQRLDVASRISLSLRNRPEAVAIVSAIAATENQLGVARKVGQVSALQVFDARERLIDAFEAQAWTERFLVETSRFDPIWSARSAASRALITIFVHPFARFCAAQRSAGELRNALIVQTMGRCVFQSPKYPEDVSRILNPIEATASSSTASRAVRANRLLLDFEGNQKIEEVREKGATEATSICPDRKWIFDGATLHLEPPIPTTAPALPAKHTLNRAASKPS
jgi:hypothetical protein